MASAHLHVARTVCRRAERAVVSLARDGHVGQNVAVFINRLSDYLFVAARYAAMRAGAEENVYKKTVGVTTRTMESSSAAAVSSVDAGASTAAESSSATTKSS